ncbi:DUF6193 family natural product biosynthesis protein [Streptomyces xanthochromogenes]|uniref:DUF6193 family natural product biosynthesis protein n=1 Tax=Streptomyces xanthochromogenes TaxID=67384 RepID=UPI003425544A
MAEDLPHRTPQEDWEEVLALCRPPHRDGDEWTPTLWRLVQTASQDPLLRTLYPWIAVGQLHVARTADWLNKPDPYPSIAAAYGEFSVIAYPPGKGAVLLRTQSPAEAVAWTVNLIREEEFNKKA